MFHAKKPIGVHPNIQRCHVYTHTVCITGVGEPHPWPNGSGVDENVKSLQTDGQTIGQTDDEAGDQKSSLRWAKKYNLLLLM